jgi:ECF sigma factor
MARRQRCGVEAALNTTALVHELYLKLSASRELSFVAPGQFFDHAAHAMRHILVDRARDRMAIKRSGHVMMEDSDAALTVAEDGRANAAAGNGAQESRSQ